MTEPRKIMLTLLVVMAVGMVALAFEWLREKLSGWVALRGQLTDHGQRMTAIENTLKHQSEGIADIKPKVATLEERMHMSRGAANLAVVLGKAAHIISAAIGGAIVLLLDKLVFHK